MIRAGGTAHDEFELYELAVEMADRISARRAVANGFFLTLLTGLSAFVSVITRTGMPERSADRLSDEFAAVVGVVLAGTWGLLLRSYRDLNAAKFRVILDLEERMSVALFSDEWAHLLKGRGRGRRYVQLGVLETVVPLTFATLYLVELVIGLTR